MNHDDECVATLRAFDQGGASGLQRLKQVWTAIRTHYHGGDQAGWEASCERAFDGRHAELRESGWNLSRLEVGAPEPDAIH